MTSNPLLATLLPLVDDLSRELPDEERYRRLLEALRELLPCDASALLRLEGEQLVPLAVDGLSPDTLGRRFKIAEHPRLQALLERPGPTLFDANCGLPDPYDGLVEGVHLEVHDCMGCPLYLDEQPWGLLTLDALEPGRFSSGDLDNLQAFASLAAATVKASQRMLDLTLRAEHEQQRADAYQRAAGEAPRELVGQSPAHRQLVDEIKLVAGSDLSVLVTGETGVGKELVAQAIHQRSPQTAVEALTPDFAGRHADVATVLDAGLATYAQNLETVERLTHPVRDPRAGYAQTLDVLAFAKRYAPKTLTKTSLMLGLGETDDEIDRTLGDIRAANVDVVTLGQYMRPSPHHLAVQRFVTPDEFRQYRELALAKGFLEAVAGPLVRSSYRAERVLEHNNLGL